jgi:regulatory protein
MGNSDSLKRPLDIALRYLGSRPRSEAELRFKLRRRGFDDECIACVLSELKGRCLVDDADFARFWCENRGAFSPRSRHFLHWELKMKGVAPEIIAEATAGLDDELEALRAVKGEAHSLRGLDYPSFRKKLTAFLRRRGFDYEVTSRTIERLWKEKGT